MDLLFVVDTSGSLDPERKALASAVGEFAEHLPEGVDYRIGVMPAHGSLSKYSGKLYSQCGIPKVLRSDLLGREEIEHKLRKTLKHMPADHGADGGEEMMYSFTRSLEPDRLAGNKAHGFFRDDAALSVVFMSDENDICYPSELHGFSAFPDFVKDSDRIEPVAYQRDCIKAGQESITPQSVLDAIRSRQQGRPFLLGGVVYTDPNTIRRDGENSIGHGIVELVNAAGGPLVDLAKRDFRQALARMGQLTAKKLTLLTEFKLQDHSVIPSSITVKVDGVQVLYKYHRDTRTVEIRAADAGHAGSVVEIRYSVRHGGI